MKGQISICTAIMLNGHSNTYMYMYMYMESTCTSSRFSRLAIIIHAYSTDRRHGIMRLRFKRTTTAFIASIDHGSLDRGSTCLDRGRGSCGPSSLLLYTRSCFE